MDYTSARHLKILNAVASNNKIQAFILERDNNPTMFLKSVLCVAINRVAEIDNSYDIFRIIFNYQAIHGIQLKDEDVYAIVHLDKDDKIFFSKSGIM